MARLGSIDKVLASAINETDTIGFGDDELEIRGLVDTYTVMLYMRSVQREPETFIDNLDDFLKATLTMGSYEKVIAALKSGEIDLAGLSELSKFIIEGVMGRPTMRRSNSSDGSPLTSNSSNDTFSQLSQGQK